MNRCLLLGLTASLLVLLAVHAGAAPASEVHQHDETSAYTGSPFPKPPPTAAEGIAGLLRVRRHKKGGGFFCNTCGYQPPISSGCGGGCGGGGGSYSNSQSTSSSSASSGTYRGKK